MNIVTIDFDIIMHRSLNIYNDLVDDDNSIQTLLNENKEAHFVPNSDLFLYNYLTQFVLKCAKKLPQEKIIFIESHEDILDYIENGQLNLQEAFNVFNIDFHHDIAYAEEDMKEIIEEADCGNWVKYLFNHYSSTFNQYVWVNTDESGDAYDVRFSTTINKKTIVYNIKKYNLDALVKSADILFICRSIPWVPDEEQQLYDSWKDIIDFIYKK